MAKFDIDYEFKVPEYGTIQIEAEDRSEAEDIALQQLREDAGPDETGFEITGVRELP